MNTTPQIEQSWVDKVNALVIKTFEEMAFLETTPVGIQTTWHAEDNFYAAVVQVLEPFEGSIYLNMHKALLAIIAEGLLSIPQEELDFKMMADHLSEFANILAGNIMTESLPEDSKFKIGIPEFKTAAELVPPEPCAGLRYDVDEEPVLLFFSGQKLLALQ